MLEKISVLWFWSKKKLGFDMATSNVSAFLIHDPITGFFYLESPADLTQDGNIAIDTTYLGPLADELKPYLSSGTAVPEHLLSASLPTILVQEGSPAGFSADGGKTWTYGDWNSVLLALGGSVAAQFARFAHHYHHTMAIDAGGSVVDEQPSGYGGTISTVEVPIEALQRFADGLKAGGQNPHEGMMPTSTGEWVMADDWDEIEGQS